MSRRSPAAMGAARATADPVAAAPGKPATAPVQTAGVSLGLGADLLSPVGGMRATPVGNPEVLGVGACALAEMQIAGGVGLLAHTLERGGRFVDFQTFAGARPQVLADQLGMVFGGGPRAPELRPHPGVLRFQLPVQILKLLTDLKDTGEVGA